MKSGLVPSNRLVLDERSRIAVLLLEAPADAPRLVWVPESVSELLTFDLEAAPELGVMPPPKLDSELPKPAADGSFDPAALASILRATEASVIVHGRLRPAAEATAEEIQVDRRNQLSHRHQQITSKMKTMIYHFNRGDVIESKY